MAPPSASAVVGGTAVTAGSYTYVVAIGDTGGVYCGGTLIAPRVVLTAAHCITARPTALTQLRVLAGSASSTADLATPDGIHVFGVSSVTVHRKFAQQSMRYDAALLVLDRAVASVRPLGLAESSPTAGTTVSAAGWGETAERDANVPHHLRSVRLRVATASACRRGNTALVAFFAPSMLCASSPGRDTCSGDSGGPLVGTVAGHPVLVGITSFGDGCARAGHPGVYTRASAIRAWALGQLNLLAASFAVARPLP